MFFDKNNGDKFGTENPEKDLLDLLVEKTVSAGHMLSFKEASEDPEMVQPNNYAFYFGSFGEAAKIAWRRARPSTSDSDGLTEQGRKVVQALKKYRQSTGKPFRREVNWMSEFKESERKGKGIRYTAEQVREKLVEFYERTGRLPKQSDIADNSNDLPSWTALVNHLGPKAGWQDIIDKQKASPVPEVGDSLISEIAGPQEGEVTLAEEPKIVAAPGEPEADEHDAAVSPHQSDHGASEDNDVKVYTAHQKQNGVIIIDMKITLPDRDKPVFVTLTV